MRYILRVAKELIAREIGVIAASRLRHEVELKIAERLPTIAGISSEIDAFPIGSVRKAWNREALERKDNEIAEAEQYYRDDAMNAAVELIRLLDVPSSHGTFPISRV